MKKLHLLSTAAASLLIAAGAAAAQGMHQQMPERAPAAQRNAPAEKIAPPMDTDVHLGPATTGQGNHDWKQDKKDDKASRKPDPHVGGK
ncbi:MAG: hypothetical protein P8Y53_07675 [Pseudolabrys sp.]